MVDEDSELLLSGIQHFLFCKRQWALIHIEQQWEENVLTVEGQHVHRIADQPFRRERRGDKLIVRGMPVQSRQLGLSGICDVVEFVQETNGVKLEKEEGTYVPYPVEYKRGKPKRGDEDLSQLAAQAICLEEMLLCHVRTGYLYYDEIKHRLEVELTDDLKDKVRAIVREMRQYYTKRYTPKVKTGPFCRSCSLQHVCLPELMNKQSVRSFIERRIRE